MCTSCPQACMTSTVLPAASVVVAVLAYSAPVCSFTGSASRSVRIIKTGPCPFSITATTPCPPTFSVTAYPALRSSSAIRFAVFASASESSGWR